MKISGVVSVRVEDLDGVPKFRVKIGRNMSEMKTKKVARDRFGLELFDSFELDSGELVLWFS